MAEGKNLVGVDIGASSIKVVQLKEARKKLQVVRLGVRAAPAADDHRRARDELRRRRPRRSRASSTTRRSSRSDVAIGVYGQSRHRPQDHRADDDRRPSSTSRSTGRPSSTSPSTSSSCRSTTRCCARRPEAGQMDLLLVAAKKDEINDYAAIAARGEAQAGGRRHQRLHHPEHLREPVRPPAGRHDRAPQRRRGRRRRSTSSRKGVSAFTREITNAGNAITEEIRKAAATCSYEQAEAYKMRRRPDADRPAGGHADHQPGVRRAWPARSSARSTSTSPRAASTEIGRIFVCGGSAYLAPLVQAIEKRARVPVQLFDPMANLVGRREVRQRGRQPARWPRRWSSRSASRFAATRSAGNDPHKPPPGQQAGRAARGRRRPTPLRLWVLGVLGAMVARAIVVCLFVQKVKQDELTAIARARTRSIAGADRRHQEADRRTTRRSRRSSRSSATARRPSRSSSRRAPDRRRRSSSSRTCSRRAAARPTDRDKLEQLKRDNPRRGLQRELGRAPPLAHVVPGGRSHGEARRARARRRGRVRARAPPQALSDYFTT